MSDVHNFVNVISLLNAYNYYSSSSAEMLDSRTYNHILQFIFII